MDLFAWAFFVWLRSWSWLRLFLWRFVSWCRLWFSWLFHVHVILLVWNATLDRMFHFTPFQKKEKGFLKGMFNRLKIKRQRNKKPAEKSFFQRA